MVTGATTPFTSVATPSTSRVLVSEVVGTYTADGVGASRRRTDTTVGPDLAS